MSVLNGFHLADRGFFSREVLLVAPEILGCILQHTDDDGTVAIRITEVEAYAGERDPGAHSYRGETNRNRTMFGPAGHLYCYFTYGMHHALNVVAGQPGQPYGCLIRAGDVIEGSDIARIRRESKPRKVPLLDKSLARGPGCVAQSFGATLVNDGDDLFGGQWKFFIPDDGVILTHQTGPRVGVSGPGGDATNFPWRYWLADASSVSTYKPAKYRGSTGSPRTVVSAISQRTSIV
ncbi:DNA-3-methyladenine glycosylase [Cryobacterium lyxosi]|jgi:DNA-3-methyladenine glycosylase|uniref:Putative 3-methyladenine DNA glycosylase n=1 Tax=Cryobacterium lyxosi TaxID=1259228 RepID=A0A4R8ZFE7_9MICO|nr:DNA-3-methyladenine glycosylase [Cryobacterium lyxosi]TFD26019.1 DNA-3-methyladenine glycosylase [Cryobacterium lyxosi]